MFKYYKFGVTLVLSLICVVSLTAQTISFNESWGNAGFNLVLESQESVEIVYSVQEFSMDEVSVKGTPMKAIHLPGSFLPNIEGAPDLAGMSQYIALPQNARASLNIISYRTEKYTNIEIAPALRIPLETDNSPLEFSKDESIYSKNAFFPALPFQLSEQTIMRGVDVVQLGVTPFQYNPVTKELIVYRDIKLEVNFEGGNGQFGEMRYRNRWFDPILRDRLLNFSSLPETKHSTKRGSRDDGFEYVIITPDNPAFISWADSLKLFRNRQGISTGVYTISEVGGNDISIIENFINNAYNNWSIPPIAVLIMADYGAFGDRILSPIWDDYCASDHIYGDVNGNDMADIIMSRMTAENEIHLENMISKVLNYETNPPTYESFYNPITATGWQTERWFQICTETIGGFFKNEKGKSPIRINEVYEGNPDIDPWSTATNTSTVLSVFGMEGHGYLPELPNELGNWTGGTASDLNNAINSGSFILQHRDHGSHTGWGEPDYDNGNLNNLSNEDPIFVFSINCLTGKYNWESECFVEKFHRIEHGALGVIAPSEVSYSFVNDTYVWGLYDYMWPEFMPEFGSTIDEERGMFPAFANVAAKYFLQASSWPHVSAKEVTYFLFHHHGDAFHTLYSEVPSILMVEHDKVLLADSTSFTVVADSGAFIALSFGGEIMATAESDGTSHIFYFNPLMAGDKFDIVITKPNYFRYHSIVDVIPDNIPYVLYEEYIINDESGNGDGILDYGESILLSLGLENVGHVDAYEVSADISTNSNYINVTDSTTFFGDIISLQTVTVIDEYTFDVASDISDGDLITFEVLATDGDSVWNSDFQIRAHAPKMEYLGFTVDDNAFGNGNGELDPGETVEIIVDIGNFGSSEAYNISISLSSLDESYVIVNSGSQDIGNLVYEGTSQASFNVSVADNTPGGFTSVFSVNIEADFGILGEGEFSMVIGHFAALILDLDPNNRSGPAMMDVFDELDQIAYYTTEFPSDLSIYKTIFASLGIINSGHQLLPYESEKLIEYLDNGGNLYLEGRRTWYDDDQLPIHDKFNIDVVQDNWFTYDFIKGEPGTFTHDMHFEFDGGSPFNDYYLTSDSDAFTILTSPNPEFGCAIAFDEGLYKTIGCSVEFGDLIDGDAPSTKKQLMTEYMAFFGNVVTNVHDIPQEDISVSLGDAYPNPFSNQTTISFSLAKETVVNIEVFDINGRNVTILLNDKLLAGEHSVQWDGTDNSGTKLNSGLYFFNFKTNSINTTKKVLLNY